MSCRTSRVPAALLMGLFAAALSALPAWSDTTTSAMAADPTPEPAARRRALMTTFADGILVLHARSLPKGEADPTYAQDATFFYFTGLPNQMSALLVLDGPKQEARLFVPPPPSSFGITVHGVGLEPGAKAAQALGVASVESWDAFKPWLARRLAAGDVKRLLVDQPRRADQPSMPPGFAPVVGERTLLARSLSEAFPGVKVESAAAAIRALRWVKAPLEVAVLRETARVTSRALLAALHALKPGMTQRRAEAVVVAACLQEGAEGPSFWPWLMSGPNGHAPTLVQSVYDYHQLNRTMQAGELVRVDIGCTLGSYGADVGRTVPVSGHFDVGQREVWNLLIAGYRAGLAVIRPGVPTSAPMEASRLEFARWQGKMKTPVGREAVARLMSGEAMKFWTLHGVGIDSGEAAEPMLAEGAVIAFEPTFSVGKDAYYLEDMVLVTAAGAEVLSAGLPYTAEEIEAVMAR